MSIKEKIAQDELILYEVLRNPVLFAEFIYNLDLTEYDEPIVLWIYQKEILCDFNPYVSVCTARSTGKTFTFVARIIWYLIFNIFPGYYILYAVPSKVHLQPVWDGLIRQFRTNSLLKHFIKRTQGVNSSEHTITLLNGAQFLARIAGQFGDGRNFIGLHLPVVIADEGGYFPHAAFQEMQPIINTWMAGFQEIVGGVPTGIRENNVLYDADQENDTFTKHRVSSYDNPRITEEDVQRAIEQYGGEESDDFIHYFLGEHGSPVFSVFDRRLFEIQQYPVYKLTLDGIKMATNLDEYISKLSVLPAIPKNYGVIFGVDLGYTDPTAIYVMYLDKNENLRFHSKIQLNKVSYTIQEKVLDILDDKFKPGLIGVDEGAAGKAVIQRLMDDTSYTHKNYKKRISPINFSTSIVLGYDAEGVEIKSKAKPLAISILQEYSNGHKIIFSSTDIETIAELERMTYVRNPSGEIAYRTLTQRGGKRGEDHFTAALLCATLGFYLQNELLTAKKKVVSLAGVSWL